MGIFAVEWLFVISNLCRLKSHSIGKSARELIANGRLHGQIVCFILVCLTNAHAKMPIFLY